MARVRILAAAAAAVLVAACSGEGQPIGQATVYKQGKYQGKPDSRPYDNAPGAYSQGAQWTAGDKTGWETAIKRRQQGQNEYVKAE